MNNLILHSTVYFHKNQNIRPGMLFTYHSTNYFVISSLEKGKNIKLLSSNGKIYDAIFDKFSTAHNSPYDAWRIIPCISHSMKPIFLAI